MQWLWDRTGPSKYERVTCSRLMMTYRVRSPLTMDGNVASI